MTEPIALTPNGIITFAIPPWVALTHGTTSVATPAAAAPPKVNAFFDQRILAPQSLRWVSLDQRHTDRVFVVSADSNPATLGDVGCDGAITDRPDVVLSVQTADCAPVFLFDPARPAVGLLHAGWRGAAAGIVRNAVELMANRFGTQPGRLHAALGPAIGGCCYQVGPEVAAAFLQAAAGMGDAGSWLRPDAQPNRHRLELRGYLRAELLALGLPSANIRVSEDCTSCRKDRYFSYRRDGTGTGRMLSYVGLNPPTGI